MEAFSFFRNPKIIDKGICQWAEIRIYFIAYNLFATIVGTCYQDLWK